MHYDYGITNMWSNSTAAAKTDFYIKHEPNNTADLCSQDSAIFWLSDHMYCSNFVQKLTLTDNTAIISIISAVKLMH